MRRYLYIAAACAVLYAFTASGYQQPAQTPTKVVNKYCVGCHNQRLKTANLTLDLLDSKNPANSAESWEKVIVKLRSRAMPPPGMPRPDSATYDSVATWLETEIDKAAAAHVNPGRSATLHRLNRAEYANAVRDLTAIEVDAQQMLPPDEQAYGFENNAEALSMQPALLDRYVSAAASISRRAIGDPSMPAAFVRYGAMKNNANDLTYLKQTERMGEDFPLGTKGGISTKHYFPVDAEYVFRLRLQRTWSNEIRGIATPTQFEVRVDGARVGELTLAGSRNASRTYVYDADEALQLRVPVKAGLHQVLVTMPKSDNTVPEGAGADRLSHYSRASDVASAPIAISALLIGGPYNGKVAVDS